MELEIKIDSKNLKSHLKALTTLDYFLNEEDSFDFEGSFFFNKKKYFKELKLKKQLKPGDHVYLTDYRTKIAEVILTIKHGNFSCILNGHEIPYSFILLIEE
jgi:hypothetical protein